MSDQQIANNVALRDERVSDQYPAFLVSIQETFHSVAHSDTPLFTTNAEGLFDVFLSNIPAEARQVYTCRACRHFVERFGGLVTIDESGKTHSVLWDDMATPEFFVPAVRAMKEIVLKSSVTGVFISDQRTLGQPVTGIWSHMSVVLYADMVNRSRLHNAFQIMAEKHEDFKILISALTNYPVAAVEQALLLLKTESLYRSEKCLGVAQWFKDLHDKRSAAKNARVLKNITWLAVATAPTGFCHVNSSMIGTLLDDIVAGLPFEVVSRKFAEKMNPLQYQRPQAAPTAGNIAQAEKIVEKLGIQKSLARRFARLDELQTIWKPQAEVQEKSTGEGVFSHLKPKDIKPTIPEMKVPTITMTWDKFSRTVLPTAKNIEFLVTSHYENYSAILTAVHDDAPPILQWDKEDQRNPFSWYVYMTGSSPDMWNLKTGYCKVTGVCYQPSMWYDGNYPNQGKSIFFILDGAKDTGHKRAGAGIFPEILKSELREVRSTIEAYSKKATLEGYDEASACGLRLQSGQKLDVTFRVTTDAGVVNYKLDRLD